MKTLSALFSSMVLAPFLIQLVSVNSMAASTNSSDVQVPVNFIRRIMNFGYNNSHLWVGSLPNYLPVELPKLPNAEVIGSESRKDRHFDSFLIHLDTHDSPEQVQAFIKLS